MGCGASVPTWATEVVATWPELAVTLEWTGSSSDAKQKISIADENGNVLMKMTATSRHQNSGMRAVPILDIEANSAEFFSAISDNGTCDGKWMLRSGRTSMVNESPALWVRKGSRRPTWKAEGETAAVPSTISCVSAGSAVFVFAGQPPESAAAGSARQKDLLAWYNASKFTRPNGMDGSKEFKLSISKAQLDAIRDPGELALFLSMIVDLLWASNDPLAYTMRPKI